MMSVTLSILHTHHLTNIFEDDITNFSYLSFKETKHHFFSNLATYDCAQKLDLSKIFYKIFLEKRQYKLTTNLSFAPFLQMNS